MSEDRRAGERLVQAAKEAADMAKQDRRAALVERMAADLDALIAAGMVVSADIASAALDLALEEAAKLTDEQAQVLCNEAHDQKVWGNSAMSKRALSIADFFAQHAAAIRALKSKP